MNVGVGVGDFIKILELAIQARKRFVDAPSQYDGISMENFSHAVQDIDVLVSGCEPDLEQRAALQRISDNSISLLNNLLERLDKYREIGASSKSMTRRVKKTWKRLNWDQDDIQDFRDRMAFQLTLLNRIERQLSSRVSSRIQQDVHHLTERSSQQERDEILKWIGTVDHGSRQSSLFDEHQEGTGEWFLLSEEFQEWVETKDRMLFCPGLPGAGKTILASLVIEYLINLCENERNGGMAYHYCNFRHQDNETVNVILSSILKQLAQCSASLPDAISILYGKHKDKGTRPSLKEIVSALKSVASLHSRVFIVVDGLDECLVWRDIVAQLRDLQGANILATSRAIPEIVGDRELEGSKILEIHARDADVREYLNHNMPRFKKFVLRDWQLQEDIRRAILKSIGGMFLLARLYVDSLREKNSVSKLRNALAALPTGSSAYDKAYQDAMERIERQHQERTAVARDVLAWLTFAKRPLKIAELRIAVIIQETDSSLDEERLMDIEDMIFVCAGLVTIDKQDETVTLIHYTTQEYLKRTRADWHPDANAAIATSCLTYLLFPIFDVEVSEMNEYLQGKKAKRQLYPLLDYSIKHGAAHAHLAITKPPSIARFLSSESKITRNWLLLMANYRNKQGEDTAEWLIEQGVRINVWDADWRTPLHYAVLNGWERCVQLLLERGASLDPDLKNMTPFHYTVNNDAEKIAETFLNAGTPVDMPVIRETYIRIYQQDRVEYVIKGGEQSAARKSSTDKGLTPLHLATLTGSQRMTKFLLDHGANPNFPSDSGETQLHLALRRDLYGPKCPGIVDFWNDPESRIEVVLDHIEIDGNEDEYCSIKDWTLKERSVIVDLLLENPEVDVNAQDIFGISSLHIASRSKDCSESITQKLIDKGAKISLRTKTNKTPLHFAIRNGNTGVVSKLLTLGANPMDDDANGLNALHYAAQQGHLQIMQDISNRIPDLSLETFLKSKDKQGQNVLHHLLCNNANVDISVAKYAFERFNGINDLDNDGMSPMALYLGALVLCAYQGDLELLDLMFEYGADPAFKTAEGLGLVHLVAGSHRFSVSVLRKLARWDVNLRSKDEQGRTALHHSSIEGTLTEDVLHFLCEEIQLSVALRDVHGNTPLDYATKMGQKDHDPNIYDPHRWVRTEALLRGLQKEI
ncbi:hypothetical protein FOXYS1_4771 [Fusarium oxysporum]|uniref:NACHT domain-containing protein n=1 Tax=Fusarium oxysporum TaxID=5507 RepID=A0A8H5AFU1_FUSOX|nr:hypothetical protein FOXYS1_4771 [Fusarium oxysporum]